jgi:hypothetical protein
MDLLRRKLAVWALVFAGLLTLSACGERWRGEAPDTSEAEEGAGEENGEDEDDDEEEDLIDSPLEEDGEG